MKNFAKYLQIGLFLYFLIFLMFFIFFDVLGGMFGMDPLTPESLVKVLLTGTILYLATWGTTLLVTSSLNTKIKNMEAEMNSLKAKLYDYEHPKTAPVAPKPAPTPSKPVPQKNQDEPSGAIRPRQNFTDQ